jgi:hypothetical protein
MQIHTADSVGRSCHTISVTLKVADLKLEALRRTCEKESYPFQTYLPQGQGIVSVGCFFTIGCRHTGQFLRHMLIGPLVFSYCNPLGKLALTDSCVEFVSLLNCCENRECFTVGGYRSRQIVEWRGVFGSCTSCYLSVR